MLVLILRRGILLRGVRSRGLEDQCILSLGLQGRISMTRTPGVAEVWSLDRGCRGITLFNIVPPRGLQRKYIPAGRETESPLQRDHYTDSQQQHHVEDYHLAMAKLYQTTKSPVTTSPLSQESLCPAPTGPQRSLPQVPPLPPLTPLAARFTHPPLAQGPIPLVCLPRPPGLRQ